MTEAIVNYSKPSNNSVSQQTQADNLTLSVLPSSVL